MTAKRVPTEVTVNPMLDAYGRLITLHAARQGKAREAAKRHLESEVPNSSPVGATEKEGGGDG